MSQSFPELVRANRSYRSFDPARKVTPEELAYIVSLARITPSAANLQPLRYRLVSGEEMKVLLPCTKWAAALPERHFPPAGHEPTDGSRAVCVQSFKYPSRAFTPKRSSSWCSMSSVRVCFRGKWAIFM